MTITGFPSDIEIAQSVRMRPIEDVAADIGLDRDDLELYGRYKAKLPLELASRPARGRLVLVSSINSTPVGEGKSTTAVGLSQALRRLGHNAILCIREPSLGPVFGVKGGAAGGGYSQVLPMEDINLHFTGDFHAISSAHALLAALVDNHLQQGNALGLDPRRITWPRTLDMNDRALRSAVIGLGGASNGVPREERWVIVPASEVMAVVALATGVADLQERLGRIIVGSTGRSSRTPVRARDLEAVGGMSVLLKDAIRPNLVQTIEGGPAFVHAGPFGNIAHGCNSLIATKTALALGDIVITEAGFGSDLGAEKFFDIKCRFGGLQPEAAVLVATVRSLKYQGGVPIANLSQPDIVALEAGLVHLERHVDNLRQFGVPTVIALNRRTADTEEELQLVMDAAAKLDCPIALSEVWERGGAGGVELANELLALLERKGAEYRPLYPVELPIKGKIDMIVRKVYGGDGADFSPKAERAIEYLTSIGMGETPVCMAKTQFSLTDDATRLGRPRDFRISVNEVYPSAGAGFVVAQCGDIMTMPGLSKSPAAWRMQLRPDGTVGHLF
jgi:formate--tetrahydrofolate ligase